MKSRTRLSAERFAKRMKNNRYVWSRNEIHRRYKILQGMGVGEGALVFWNRKTRGSGYNNFRRARILVGSFDVRRVYLFNRKTSS